MTWFPCLSHQQTSQTLSSQRVRTSPTSDKRGNQIVCTCDMSQTHQGKCFKPISSIWDHFIGSSLSLGNSLFFFFFTCGPTLLHAHFFLVSLTPLFSPPSPREVGVNEFDQVLVISTGGWGGKGTFCYSDSLAISSVNQDVLNICTVSLMR